jgi:tetratricopeptide (TPR) repeat protein
MPSRKVIAAFAFIALAVLYISTMCRTVYTMDCGELMVAAQKLQLAHPTGYPLFCILWKLGTFLVPFGSVAWQMNAFNAIVAAAAVTMLFLAVSEVTRRWTALFVSLLFAVTPLFWDVATSTEVHSLAALILATELFLFFRWRSVGDRRLLAWLALVAGLGMTNHLSSALVLPGIMYGVIRREPGIIRDFKFLGRVALLFALPLSLYLYMPLRAEASRGTIWGDVYRSAGFVSHVTGKAFRTLMFTLTPGMVWDNVLRFLRLLILEFPITVAWVLPIGAFVVRRREKFVLGTLLLMIVPNVLYNINYAINDIEPYYVPTMLALSVMLAMGFDYLLTEVRKPVFAKAFAVLMPVLLVCVVFHEYPRMDKSQNTVIMDHAQNVLRSLDEGALFVACGDSSYNAMYYEMQLNGERPDIIVTHRNLLRAWPKDSKVWVAHDYYDQCSERSPAMQKFRWENKRYTRMQVHDEVLLCDMIDEVIKERPVFITCMGLDGKSHPMLKRLNRDYQLLPWGVITRIVPKDQAIDYAALARANEELWKNYVVRGVYGESLRGGELEREIPERYSYSLMALGDIELKARMYPEAETNFKKALSIDSRLARARNGLALAYICQGKFREAAKEWNTVLAYQPKNDVAKRGLVAAGRNEK